jgi:serine/threonine-protein kinase
VPQAAQPQASSARPAAQQAPIARTRRGFPVGGLLFALVAIVLVAATLLLAFPGVISQVAPQFTQATATPVTLVQQPYQITDLELVVPPGKDVREAYTEAFLAQARMQYGQGTTINSNAPPAFVGDPEQLSDDAGGTKYRATMQGFIFVPQQ